MRGVQYISYEEWMELLNGVKQNGIKSAEFEKLKISYPLYTGSSYEFIIINELAKLETILIKNTINKFQNDVNKCFEEIDLEIFDKTIKNLKKNIKSCFFYVNMQEYRLKQIEEISGKIEDNFMSFIKEFDSYVNKMYENEDNSFTQEFEYIYKKNKLKKFIQECRRNG